MGGILSVGIDTGDSVNNDLVCDNMGELKEEIMEERRKLCETCNWFDPERQLCLESGRYMIAKAYYCWAYDPIITTEETDNPLMIVRLEDLIVRQRREKGTG